MWKIHKLLQKKSNKNRNVGKRTLADHFNCSLMKTELFLVNGNSNSRLSVVQKLHFCYFFVFA